MLNVLDGRESHWLVEFANDFHKRFLSLLSYDFHKFTAVQALSVLESSKKAQELHEDDSTNKVKELSKSQMDDIFSPFDLKRLDSYANNLLDYHVIVDMLPMLSLLYFGGKMGDSVKLSSVQSAILLAIGLQRKSIDDISKELNLPANQTIAMFAKVMRKISVYFRSVLSESIEETLPAVKNQQIAEMDGEEIKTYDAARALDQMDEELEEAGSEAIQAMKEKQKELINSLNLEKYAINENSEGWEQSKKSLEKAAKSKGCLLYTSRCV